MAARSFMTARGVLRTSTGATLLRAAPRRALPPSFGQSCVQGPLQRGYATEATRTRKNTYAIYGALGLGAVSLFAYAYTRPGDSDTKEAVRDVVKAVHDLSPEAYQRVYNDIAQILEKEDYDDGSMGPVFVRLAWHCSGTWDKTTGTGGSNGATMRFAPEASHGANAGLIHARDALESVKLKHPGISYSDLWTLAGVCAVQEMGGPTVPWRPGREDRGEEHSAPDGRLPDGDKGSDHLRWVFTKMGFSDKDIVALSGAHALGRCHKDRSGFEGPWTHSPTSFTNDYFVRLFEDKWQARKWDGPKQYQDDATKSLMMLETDMTLIRDPEFRKYAEVYAKDEGKFFEDFAKAFQTLLELGVPEKQFGTTITLKPTHEQAQ